MACGADIVCVELEDGIAPKDKEEARIKGLSLFAIPQPDDGVERIVRINGLRTAYGLADVQAVLATDTDKIPSTYTHVLIRNELIRQRPRLDAVVNRTLEAGTQVYVVEFVSNWALIARGGQKLGYVPADALVKLR